MSQGSKAGRILGLDYGEARIGVAVSDELRTVARAVTTIHHGGPGETLDAIARVVCESGACAVVVGLPRNMDGTLGESAQRVQSFAAQLRESLPVPVLFVDERLSTREAEQIRPRRLHKGRKRSRNPGADALAAAVILQRYLDGEETDPHWCDGLQRH